MVIENVLGALIGIIYGFLIGAVKYFALWNSLQNKQIKQGKETQAIASRLLISAFINLISLSAIFFLKDYLPFSYIVILIAAASSLSISGRIFPINSIIKKHNK